MAIAQLETHAAEIDALRRGSSAHQLSARYDEQIEMLQRQVSEQAARDAQALYQAQAAVEAARAEAREAHERARRSRELAECLEIEQAAHSQTRAQAAERLAAMAERERALLKELSTVQKQQQQQQQQIQQQQQQIKQQLNAAPNSPAVHTAGGCAWIEDSTMSAFPNPVTASPPSPPTANADSGSAGSDGLEPEGDAASGGLPAVSSPPAQGLVLPNMGLVLPESLVASSWSPPSASSTSSARSTHSLRSTRAMPMSPLPLAPPPRGLEAMLQSAQREIEGLHDVVRQQMHVQGVLENERAAVL